MELARTLAPLLPYACALALAGLAVHQRRRITALRARISDAARTDPLTGLLNRRALEELLEHGARARDARRPPAVGDRGRPRFLRRGERAPWPRRRRQRPPARGRRLPQVEAPHRPGGPHRRRGVRAAAAGDRRARRLHRRRAPAPRDAPDLRRGGRAGHDQLRRGEQPRARERPREPAARRRPRRGRRQGPRQRPHRDLQRRGGAHARAVGRQGRRPASARHRDRAGRGARHPRHRHRPALAHRRPLRRADGSRARLRGGARGARAPRGRAARHRQDRDLGPRALEARAARRGRVAGDVHAPGDRRAPALAARVRRPARLDPRPPRAAGRHRLPVRAERRRHPDRGPHPRGRRRVRGHDRRPRLPAGARRRGRARGAGGGAGTQFDPEVVGAFLKALDAGRARRLRRVA